MQPNKIKIETLKKYILLTLLVLSIGILILNRGFNYTEYSSSYVIALKGEFKDQALDEVLKLSNPAKIDRANGIVQYQKIEQPNYNLIVTQLKEKFKDAGDKLTIETYLKDPAPLTTVGQNSFVFVLSIFLLLYTLYRTIWKSLDKQDRLKILISLALSFGVGLIVSLGIISALSLVTMVSEISVYSLLLAAILVALISYTGIRDYIKSGQLTKIDAALERIVENIQTQARTFVAIILVGLAILMLSLGVRFVLNGALFFISLVIITQSISVLTHSTYDLLVFDWKHIGGQINKHSNKPAEVDKTNKLSKKKKSKNKSKK